MLRIQFYKYVAAVLCVLLLNGCEKPQRGAVGDSEIDDKTPEYAALMFARSIYHEESIDGAVALSTDRMQRVLNSYHTNRNVQRHVLNLKYDKVNIIPDGGNKIGRAQFSETASITLFFSGTYDDDRIEDLRTVQLVRQNGQWKVDRVTADYM